MLDDVTIEGGFLHYPSGCVNLSEIVAVTQEVDRYQYDDGTLDDSYYFVILLKSGSKLTLPSDFTIRFNSVRSLTTFLKLT